VYIALLALGVNLIICVICTPIFSSLLHLPTGQDATTPADYAVHPVAGIPLAILETQLAKAELVENAQEEKMQATVLSKK
jgi:hypothetical protein